MRTKAEMIAAERQRRGLGQRQPPAQTDVGGDQPGVPAVVRAAMEAPQAARQPPQAARAPQQGQQPPQAARAPQQGQQPPQAARAPQQGQQPPQAARAPQQGQQPPQAARAPQMVREEAPEPRRLMVNEVGEDLLRIAQAFGNSSMFQGAPLVVVFEVHTDANRLGVSVSEALPGTMHPRFVADGVRLRDITSKLMARFNQS